MKNGFNPHSLGTYSSQQVSSL